MSELVKLASTAGDDVLRAALQEQVSAGNAILLLDALDETHDARDRVVNHLRRLLRAAHPDLDFVLSSRHSAAEAATGLGIAQYVLETPRQFEITIDRLLEYLVPDQLTAEGKYQWLSVRRDYVQRSQHEEPTIWSVPLLATLAVLLLSERNPSEMPATRAELLHEVIRDSVRRWAARRSDVALPSLDIQGSTAVLIDTFADIASVVAGDGAWHSAKRAVVNRLQQHWRLAPGVADTVAEHVIDHWDAAAGVFVTNTVRGPLTARSRLFTEIGDALWHTRDDADARAWVEQAVTEPDRWETIRLAAGLTPRAAAALVDIAVDSGDDLLDIACDAWEDGADLTDAHAAALVTAQLHRLSQASMKEPPLETRTVKTFITDRTSPFTKLAMRLAQLPLSETQVTDLIELCRPLPKRQLEVLEAVAIANRATLDINAPDGDTLDRIELALLTDDEIEELRGDDHSRSWHKPHGLDALVDVVLTFLLPARPHSAHRIARTAYETSIGTYERTDRELRSRGHEEALQGVSTRFDFGAGIDWERMRKNMQEPFQTIRTSLDSTPVSLTAGQAWHLDEAGALIDALRVASATAGLPGEAVRWFKPQSVELIKAFIEASSLPQSVVVAQMNQVYTENPERPEWGLLFLPSSRLRIDSLNVQAYHLTVALDALKTGNVWLGKAALDLYLEAGGLSDDQARALLVDIQYMAAWSRHDGAIALSVNRPDIALPLDDPAIRAGNAAARTYTLVRDERARDAIEFLADPDLMVRAAAADQLRDVAAEDLPALQAALDRPARQWTCPWCDAVRAIDENTCPGPRHSRPEPKLKE